ncbi:hypothetical protein GQ53DRAFT_845487 [Thozetella sp. PMI_491]|nr:hypothetical protein GQ53DRAFT_845487 [Thozetella sp. PMI_491]
MENRPSRPKLPLPRARDDEAGPSHAAKEPKRPKEFRPRVGKPKTRNGCIVCKIRKVKCDEAKPYCLRCTTTGRRCEGYATPQSARPQNRSPEADAGAVAVRTPSPSLAWIAEPANEKRSLHLLWTVTQHVTCRYFGTGFWTSVILPAADSFTSVRRSLVALSTMYETYLNREHDGHRSQSVLDTPTSRYALIEYNKAVQLLSRTMSAGRLPRHVVLICCLLFVWLEFLRNDFGTAFRHLKSGLLILEDIRQTEVPIDSPSVSELDEIHATIGHVFTRLQIQATVHGSPDSDFNSEPLTSPLYRSALPRAFRNVDDARDALDSRLLHIFQFIREKQVFERALGAEAAVGLPKWSQLQAERDSHVRELEEWHTAFTNSPELFPVNGCKSPGFLVLEINHTMASIQLTNVFSETEMDYDLCISQFEHIVELAGQVLHCLSRDMPTPLLTFDMGIIPALFYVSLKCRESSVRHRALELLKLAPEREGIWHRDTLAAAAKFKISLEESSSAYHLETSRPPESIRIYRELVKDADEKGGRATITFDGGELLRAQGWELQGLISRLGDVI